MVAQCIRSVTCYVLEFEPLFSTTAKRKHEWLSRKNTYHIHLLRVLETYVGEITFIDFIQSTYSPFLFFLTLSLSLYTVLVQWVAKLIAAIAFIKSPKVQKNGHLEHCKMLLMFWTEAQHSQTSQSLLRWRVNLISRSSPHSTSLTRLAVKPSRILLNGTIQHDSLFL